MWRWMLDQAVILVWLGGFQTAGFLAISATGHISTVSTVLVFTKYEFIRRLKTLLNVFNIFLKENLNNIESKYL